MSSGTIAFLSCLIAMLLLWSSASFLGLTDSLFNQILLDETITVKDQQANVLNIRIKRPIFRSRFSIEVRIGNFSDHAAAFNIEVGRPFLKVKRKEWLRAEGMLFLEVMCRNKKDFNGDNATGFLYNVKTGDMKTCGSFDEHSSVSSVDCNELAPVDKRRI